jgi:hypothetical protein
MRILPYFLTAYSSIINGISYVEKQPITFLSIAYLIASPHAGLICSVIGYHVELGKGSSEWCPSSA